MYLEHNISVFRSSERIILQVIVIDWNENSVSGSRDNALILNKWEGDNSDRQLIGLTQLLRGKIVSVICLQPIG